jgi:SAM-dependent methyltransferase
LNPPTQYADDRNLRARQRLWEQQEPHFDLVAWVLDLEDLAPGMTVLDVGCGNGAYLGALHDRSVAAVGCDLSIGMLRSASQPHERFINADVTALPVRTGAFDAVLAPHMLYHVDDRVGAARELRRALKPGGICVLVTNGARHLRSVRDLVETAARRATPGWEWRNPSTHAFSLDNGAAQLDAAFASVTLVRPDDVAPVAVRDAEIVADYVASVRDHYQREVDRPWTEIVAEVRTEVEAIIAREGAFVVAADSGAFICR